MRILFYNPEVCSKSLRLFSILRDILPQDSVEQCTSLNHLNYLLCRSGAKPQVAVLMAPTIKALADLASLTEALEPVRKILVLPDLENETVSLGLKLRPSYYTKVGGAYRDLQAVLQKIYSLENQPNGRSAND